MHIPLVFLGEVGEERLGELEEKVRRGLEGVRGFRMGLGGLGVFPNLHRPRVVWVGLEEKLNIKSSNLKVGRLVELVRNLKKRLEQAGFEFDKKKFHPHITIGRVKRVEKSPEGAETLIDLKDGSFGVDSILIIKSELRPTGSVYTVLARILLVN